MTHSGNYTQHDSMVELFDLLCQDFKYHLEERTLGPADRKSLLEFLKDNGINCVGSNNQSIKSIIDTLPFSDDEGEL